MATFAIIHGGGDSAASWGPACAELRALGHHTVAVDLPCQDLHAGWDAYTQSVVRAVQGRPGLIVVGHSLGGFTAALVCARVPAQQLVFVAGMIPQPGALAGVYWDEAGYQGARFDEEAFYHDMSEEHRALGKASEREQAEAVMKEPWPLRALPALPTRYLLGRLDRVFPAPRSRELVRERLGITADELDAGHCMQLQQPRALAERLASYA